MRGCAERMLRVLARKIQHAVAHVQHQYQTNEEKQPHQDIENAVAFAACVLDIVHAFGILFKSQLLN